MAVTAQAKKEHGGEEEKLRHGHIRKRWKDGPALFIMVMTFLLTSSLCLAQVARLAVLPVATRPVVVFLTVLTKEPLSQQR